MRKFICLFILILAVASCKEKQPVRADNEALYKIDLDNITVDESPLLASSIFKSVKTIILEDNDNAIMATIGDMQITEDNIFVLDRYPTKKLFVFDKSGKYLRQIGSLGQGPGEYNFLSDFCVDPEKREIYLLDVVSGKVLKYNFDTGEYLDSFKVNNLLHCTYLTFCNNKLYIATVPHNPETPGNLILEIDLKTGEQKEYLDADTYNAGWNRMHYSLYNFFTAKSTDSQRFIEFYMNTIMSIDKDGMKPYLSLKHKNWVQKSDLLSEKELEERNYEFELQKAWLSDHNYIESDNFISFCYKEKDKQNIVFFDKNKQSAKIFKHLKNDLRDNKNIDGYGTRFFIYDSHAAYEYFSVSWWSDFHEKIHEKDFLAPNLDKRNELMKLGAENTVIFVYEFK